MTDVPTVLTFGHSTAGRDQLVPLLHDAGVQMVVDVRSYPTSHYNPDARQATMKAWLAAAGIDYEHLPQLGGRRSGDSPADCAWREQSFRAYAGWTRTDPFRVDIRRLLDLAAEQCVAYMCAEVLWWKCHRRLISDYLTILDLAEVVHLFHDGKLAPHRLSPGARVLNGDVFWDVVEHGGYTTVPLPIAV